jgi:hypothetical protein
MAEEFDPYRKWLGIPPQDQPAHHYRLLGIAPFEDDPDVIENAATRQLAHVRTFQTGRHAALSQRLLTELTAAKLCLLMPEKKVAYDEQLRERLAVAGEPTTELFVPIEPTVIRSPGSRWKVGPERFAPEPPPPVPLRMPAAVAANSMPIVVTTSAHSTHRMSHRQSVLPLVITAICLLVLTIGGIVAIVVGGRSLVSENTATPDKFDFEESANPAKLAAAPLATPFPVGSAVKQEAEKPRLPNQTVGIPSQGGSAMQVNEQIRSLLWQARNALASRDDEAGQRCLLETERLLAKHQPAAEGELLAELIQLKHLKVHLDRFWSAVRKSALQQARPGEKLEFNKKDSVEFVAREKDQITYKLNGEEGVAAIGDLPPRVAVAYALRDGRTNPALLVAAATFLTIDAAADQETGSHRIATKLFQEAVDLGLRDPTLAQELGKRGDLKLVLEGSQTADKQTVDKEPSSANPPPASSATGSSEPLNPPRAADSSAKAGAAAVRAARTKIAEGHREPLAAAQSSADAASSLIETFTSEVDKETKPAAQQALLEESLDLAVRWCLVEQLNTLCESLAAARGSDALETKAFFLDRCIPKTSAQAGAIKTKVDALKLIADGQGKAETSLKFNGLSIKAAITQKLLEVAEHFKQ